MIETVWYSPKYNEFFIAEHYIEEVLLTYNGWEYLGEL